MGRPDINTNLGKVIRKHRRAKALTQEALGFAAGITRNYVSLVELGQSSPTAEVLDAIGQALDTTGSALLAEAENFEPLPPRRAKR